MFKVRRTFHAQNILVLAKSLIPSPSFLSVPFLPFSPFKGLGGFSFLACSFFARRLGAGLLAPRLSCLAVSCVRHLRCRSFVRGVLCPVVFLSRSVSSPFRHPFTSRRCTSELVPFRIMLGSLACSFFARIFPFSYHFHPKKFAYSKYFLYLCTRNEVQIDPK